MRARLLRLLGVDAPLVQAPMAGVQDHRLAASVCSAGALGSLPCAMLDAQTMRIELQRLREVTDKPFNVNFFCHDAPVPDETRQARWRERLTPYYRELGLDAAGVAAGAGRAPFSEALADALEPFRPRVVSFHFGLPARGLLDRLRGWGSVLMSSATTLDEALWLQDQGVDVIIAQGLEAGGHRGMFLSERIDTQVGTFALLPQVVDRVRLPVIAAGGIADARGVAAAMALGAAGVQVGTAYLLCPESTTSAVHRAALASPAARHTALTNLFTGRPARGIVNRVMRELGPVDPLAPAFPLATPAITALRTKAEAQGSDEFSPLWSGQNNSACRAIPAAQLTRELAAGFG